MIVTCREAGLQLLANVICNQFENASRHIIGGPFVLTADGWQAFEPPGSLRSVFAMLAGQYDCKAWADYRRHVQKQVEKSGESVLVAELSLCVMERESEYSTSVIWTRDVDTILPSADGVHFEDPADGSIRYAAWKMVRAVMGPAMEAYDGAPEVWRVKGFPTPEQFLAMGAQVQARAAG